MRLLETAVYLALASLGISWIVLARAFDKGSLQDGSTFPTIVAAVIVITSAMQLFQLARASGPSEAIFAPQMGRRIAGVLALAALFVVLMPVVGFPITNVIWLTGTMWLLGLRAKKTIATVAVILTLIAHFFFAEVAHAPLPVGVWVDMLFDQDF